MSGDDAFVEYLCDLLEPLGECSARKMFGAYGLHCDDLMIGLVDDGQLFLKVDEQTKSKFAAAGCAAVRLRRQRHARRDELLVRTRRRARVVRSDGAVGGARARRGAAAPGCEGAQGRHRNAQSEAALNAFAGGS
jgi:TfoX/Sxy family transcriptional regulator of competence genes